MSDSGRHPQKGDENISKVKDKLQRFFGRGKSQVPLTIPKPTTQAVIFTPEILKEIGPESPANNRLKTIGQLCDEVRQRRLENNAVEALWGQISDLLYPNVSTENRHLALQFLQCLLQGQLQYMTVMRAHFFRVIQNLTEPDDLMHRVELFATLSEGGKNLLYFEDETGQLLLDWMPEVMAAGHITKLLPIILFVIKYNAAYLDEIIVSGLVKRICAIPNRPRTDDELRLCLEVMDAVIRYSYLPTDSMYHFIAALCQTVDKKTLCEKVWELMRKLLGTYLGHSAIYTMCCMLQDKRQPVNALLLRGAIFFTGMALWGSKKVPTLKHTHASVLPSFHQALSHGYPIVAYEVILNVQRLVNKYGKDLHPIAWEIVMDILEKLLIQIDGFAFENKIVDGTHEKKIVDETHNVISCMESLHNTRQFFGPTARLFKIVEMCASNRPTSSVCALMDYHMHSIHPGVEDWILDLNNFMEKYLKGQTRTDVRKKALDILSLLITINSHAYESELLEGVVIPHFSNLDTDPDSQVRCKAVELLLSLCEDCNSDHFFQLTTIVEKIMMKPVVCALMEADKDTMGLTSDETVLIDIQRAVNKTIEVFRTKLYTAPASHCQKLYEMLVDHMDLHYKHMYLGTTACSIRKSIFDLLVLLRADGNFRVGLSDRKPGQGHVYSPYVLCSPSEDFEALMMKSPGLPGMSPSQMYSVIKYEHTFKAFLSCLESERDWNVLRTVLLKLPIILENKTLVLSADYRYIDALCAKLCAVVKDRDRTSEKSQKLINRPKDFTRSDLHSYFFPVIASVVTYHASLDKNRLRELVNCLEFGLVSKCAKICVTTLRICSLEIKELMMRMLPTVLLSLSRITATISMAIPVLAFLSSIVRIPMLYANFVEDQYMSVFAIALPYTNPFKFSHYTVSLAHHVIGVWFIRCRLPFRKGFVKYIQRGLKYNVLQLFEENSLRHLNTNSNQNQNSSDRGRSGSLNEGRKRMRNHSGVEGVRNDGRIPMDENMSQFHKELTETCVDMMSRYAFGNYAAFPKRSPIVDFLLKDGQKDTWVIGNKIITITTSGSGNPSNPSGICDKCMAAFENQQQQNQQAASPASATSSTPRSDRRRHKSMASLSKSHMEGLGPSQDGEDSLLRRHRYQDDMRLLQEPNPNPNPLSFDDVAVQTGTSLGICADFTGLDSMTSEIQEPRAFLSNQCSCWCTGWAEVHIRGASGVISWMMRIANEPSSYSFTLDPSIPDITQLLAPVRCKTPDTESLGKIDSGSLCEEEYETLHSQHFSEVEKNLFQEDETTCSVPSSSSVVTSPKQVPASADTSGSSGSQNQVHSPSSLRRISSSPSLTYGIPLLESAVDCIKSQRDKSFSPEHVVKTIEVMESKSSPSKADDFSRTRESGSADRNSTVEERSSSFRPLTGSGKEYSSHFAKKISQQSEEESKSTTSFSLSTSTSNIVEDVFNSSRDSLLSTGGGSAIGGDGGGAAAVSAKNITTTTRTTPAVMMNTSFDRIETPATNKSDKSEKATSRSENVETMTPTTWSSPGKGKKPAATRSFSVDLPGQNRPHKLKLTSSMEKNIPKSTEYPEDGNPSSWRDEVPELRQMKRRGHTISVMSPALEANLGDESDSSHYKNNAGKDGKGGLNPSFVFLQLYHCHPLIQSQEVPIHVPKTEEFQRTVERLDHIYPYETHKIGVLYMGKGQKSEEKALLRNEYGSPRYTQFIQDLGHMISIEDAEKEKLYLGGLTSEDGKFTVAWNDESLRVVFHVATLMRSRPSDPNCNYKKSHIGNDFVSIVYNDSSEQYKIGTISGQFNFVSIVIRPLDHGSNAVYLITKEVERTHHITSDIADILGHTHTKIISDKNLPLLVRQIAIHCNLASMVLQRQQSAVGSPEVFASNWLERLRKIKLLKKRVMEHYAEKNGTDVASSPVHVWPQSKAGGDAAGIGIEDFTDYV